MNDSYFHISLEVNVVDSQPKVRRLSEVICYLIKQIAQ